MTIQQDQLPLQGCKLDIRTNFSPEQHDRRTSCHFTNYLVTFGGNANSVTP